MPLVGKSTDTENTQRFAVAGESLLTCMGLSGNDGTLWNWMVLMVPDPRDMLNSAELYTLKGVNFVIVNSILRGKARCPDEDGLVCKQGQGQFHNFREAGRDHRFLARDWESLSDRSNDPSALRGKSGEHSPPTLTSRWIRRAPGKSSGVTKRLRRQTLKVLDGAECSRISQRKENRNCKVERDTECVKSVQRDLRARPGTQS